MIKRLGFGLILMVLFSSCFEVVEDITFKKDGSGIMKLIINLSQSKNEINSLLKLDSSSGYKIPSQSDINYYIDQAVRSIKTSEGISKVNVKRDFTNWLFEISLEFNHTDNLEAGLKNLYSDFSDKESFLFRNVLAFDGKNFERDMQPPKEELRDGLNRPTEKRILSKAKYTSIYRFEKPIESYSNKNAKISPTRKAIMFQGNILNLINGKETIHNTIILK
jgi:hypothetical protein